MAETKLKITLRKSPIGYRKDQGATARALGLRKLNATVIRKNSPQTRGMVQKIIHLVDVEEVEAE